MMSHYFHEEITRHRYAEMLRNARQAELAALVRAEHEHTSLFARGHALVSRFPGLTRARRRSDVRAAHA